MRWELCCLGGPEGKKRTRQRLPAAQSRLTSWRQEQPDCGGERGQEESRRGDPPEEVSHPLGVQKAQVGLQVGIPC